MSSNIEKVYGLTPMQKGMLFNYIKSGKTTYFVQKSTHLKGRFNLNDAVSSFRILSKKYDILRTSIFYNSGTEPKQVVLKNREIEVNIVHSKEETNIEKIENDDFNRGFDLTQDSLLRVTLVVQKSDYITIIWSFNHIILDGWCMSILLNDFFKYYELLNEGNTVEEILSNIEKTLDYKEYIDWLNCQDNDAAKQYWLDFIADYTDDFHIESRDGHSNKLNKSKGIVRYNSTSIQIEQYKQFCNKHGITLSVLFEFCWGLFLAKHNFTKDIVFGKVVSGRRCELPGIEKALGLFINTIPTRVSIVDNLTSLDYLKKLYNTNIDSEQFDFYPLFEVLKLDKNNGNLINSLFIFENYFVDEKKNNQPKNLELILDDKPEHTEYPLTLAVINRGNYEYDINYNPDIFSEQEVDIYMSQFVNVIESVTKYPNKLVSDITLCSDEEENKITSYSKGKLVKLKVDSIIDQFYKQVELNPEKVAIVSNEESMTYKELCDYVGKIESILILNGIKKGDRIVLHFDKNIDLVASMLASLTVGGTYVPVDKKFSEERINFIIKDSDAKVILSDSDVNGVQDVVVLNVKTIGNSDNSSIANFEKSIEGEHNQYILYTSGTTGRPKGVIVKEKSVINLTSFLYNEIYKHCQGGNIGLIANQIFDASVQQIFTSLMYGFSLYLIDDDLKFAPPKLFKYINDNNIKILDGTPSYIDLLVNQNNQSSLNVDIYIIGGEILPPKLLKDIFRVSPTADIYNVYGPTEMTVDSTCYKCSEKDIVLTRVPIGKPIYNTELKIKNDNHICAIGQIGEITISGEGLSAGYTNSELNDQCFQKVDSSIEYHTGDLGYWNLDGDVIILGRRDSQIKLNGYRIELTEIDNCLVELEEVASSHSIVENNNIYTFVVSEKESIINNLRSELQKKLPYYMVPRDIIPIEKIPMSFSGKVDVQVLKELITNNNRKEENDIEDNLNLVREEEVILNTYKTIFQREDITLNDNFFNLGGDSIYAIRIVSLLSEYDVKVNDILNFPVLRDLSKFIQKNNKTISQEEVTGRMELLPSHRRFIKGVNKKTANHFNQSIFIKSEVKLNLELVNEIYHTLLKHHDSLRISYNYDKDYAELIDYESIEKKQDIIVINCKKSEMWEYATSEQKSMSLNEGNVFKIVVFKTEEGEFLLFILHHFTSDAVSLRILFDDFSNLYRNKNDETSLPLKTVSVKEFAKAINEYKQNSSSQIDRMFWKENYITFNCENYTPCTFSESEKFELKLEKSVISELKNNLSKLNDIDMQDVLLLSFLESYFKTYKKEQHLSIDMEGHGRNSEAIDLNVSRTVGWFTSVYPLLFKPDVIPSSFSEKVSYIHKRLKSVPNGGLTYALQTESNSKFRFSSIMFNFLGEFDSKLFESNEFSVMKKSIGEEVSGDLLMQNPLILNMLIHDGDLVASFIYDKKVFSKWKLKKFSKVFKKTLIRSIKQIENISEDTTYNNLIKQIQNYTDNKVDNYVDILNPESEKNIYVFPPAMLKIAYLPIYKAVFSELDYKTHVFHLTDDNELIKRISEYIINQGDTSITFVGYSGGSNIAYDVSIYLDQHYNKKVNNIVMLDGFKWEDGLDFVTVTEENIDDMLDDFLAQSNINKEDLDEKIVKIIESERTSFLLEAKIYQDYCQLNKNKHILLQNTKIFNILSEDTFVDKSKDTRRKWDSISNLDVEYIRGVGSHLSMLTDKKYLQQNRRLLKDILETIAISTPIISAKNLTKTYGSGDAEVHALKSVSINIFEKEFICILGSSGSGKSTLLNSLSTLEEFDSGELKIYSQSVDYSDSKQILKIRKDYIGFVFQQYLLLPNLNVRDNIETGRYLAKSELKIDKILGLLSLEDKLEKYPSQLSGGEQQRVSIARALAKNSKILFCDEPTGALDTKTGITVLKVLKQIQKQEGLTIVLVTHNSQISKIADRVIYMKDGEIIKEKTNEFPLSIEEVDWE